MLKGPNNTEVIALDVIDLDTGETVILVKRNTDYEPYVTAICMIRDGVMPSEWHWGHYCSDLAEAREDFDARRQLVRSR